MSDGRKGWLGGLSVCLITQRELLLDAIFLKQNRKLPVQVTMFIALYALRLLDLILGRHHSLPLVRFRICTLAFVVMRLLLVALL